MASSVISSSGWLALTQPIYPTFPQSPQLEDRQPCEHLDQLHRRARRQCFACHDIKRLQVEHADLEERHLPYHAADCPVEESSG